MASLARLIGAKLPATAAPDSRDQLDTWLGLSDEPAPYVAEMAQDHTLSLRTANWKYIEPSNGAAKQGQTGIETGYDKSPQLYHIATDPGETKNVYTTEKDTAQALSGMLAQIRMPRSSADTCFWYHLITPNRNSRYATSTGAGRGMTGTATPSNEKSQWKFVLRADGETYDIVNRADGSYIAPGQVSTPALQLKTSAKQPANGWTLTTNGIMNCLFAVSNGTSQMNQGAASRNYMVLNWGGGTNTTDAGCLYAFILADVSESLTDHISEIPVNPPYLQIIDGQFALSGTNSEVRVYDITGKRMTPATMKKRGIYIIKTDKATYKMSY